MEGDRPKPKSDWKPIDFVWRAQRETLLSVTAVMIREMQREWGEDWLEKLNVLMAAPLRADDQRSRDPRAGDPVRFVNETLDWDLAKLTRGTRVLLENLKYFSGPRLKDRQGRIRALTYIVRDTRNATAHASAELNYNDLQSAKKDLNNILEFVTHVAGTDAAKMIKAIKAEMTTWAEGKVEEPTAREGIDPADIAQIKALLIDLHRERKAVAEPEAVVVLRADPPASIGPTRDAAIESQPLKTPHIAPDAAVMPKQRKRRRNAIPSPRMGLAVFPAVSEAEEWASELCYVHCEAYEPAHPQAPIFLPLGLETAQSNLCYSIIQNARMGEASAELSVRHVRARFDPNDFQGPSFGLAAAIADRSARYGFSAAWATRQVIATGEIIKGGQGEVGPIDGFAAKVRLLEREAPAGSLFVFPSANLEAATPETLQALKRAEERGAFSWRAVDHLRQLEDLFADPAAEPRLAAKGVASAPEEPAVEPLPAARLDPRRSRRLMPVLLGAVAAGVLILAGLYGAGHLRESLRPDPVQEQAHQERIAALIRLAAAVPAMPAVPDNAANCGALAEAAKALPDAERRTAAVEQGAALDAAERCKAALAESDRRWSYLRAAAASRSDAAIADARQALTAFDLSRAGEPGNQDLLASTEAAGMALAASTNRITALEQAARSTLSEPSAANDRTLAGAAAALTVTDKARLDGERRGFLSLAGDAGARLAASDLRVAALTKAYDRLLGDNSSSTRQALRSALQSITEYDRARPVDDAGTALAAALQDGPRLLTLGLISDLQQATDAWHQTPTDVTQRAMSAAARALSADDRAMMTQEQRALLDVAREGELALLQSNARLQALLAGERAFEVARDTGQSLPEAITAFLGATESLEPFDRSRLGAEHRIALSAADAARTELSGSASRVWEALRSAEIVLAARDRVTDAMRTSLVGSYRALTPLDLARMTADETAVLDRACSMPVTGSQGNTRPLNGCKGPVIKFGPPVLKPSVPLK